MKSIKVLAVAAALVSLAVVSSGNAASKPIELAPHANIGLPMGDMADGLGLGFGAGATIDFFLANTFSIGARGSFTSFSGEDVDFGPPIGTVSIDAYSLFEISGHGRYYLGSDLARAFFLQGNLGMHMAGGSGDGSDFGFGFGAGKRFPLGASGKTILVPEVTYYIVPGDGYDATFLMFRLGVAFGLNSSAE